MTDRIRPIHIIDVEFLGIFLGAVAWAPHFEGASLGVADNSNAMRWIAYRRAQLGVALQILRTPSKWISRKNSDFSGLYGRSHRDISADHLGRLGYSGITSRAGKSVFERVSPRSVNGNWEGLIASIKIAKEWEVDKDEGEKGAGMSGMDTTGYLRTGNQAPWKHGGCVEKMDYLSVFQRWGIR